MAAKATYIDLCATKAYMIVIEDIEEAVMLAFDDSGKDLNERSSERMNFRTKPRIKQIIQRAAALSGVDDSVFTMNAAYKSAMETIAAHERTVLQPADHAAFFAALDAPAAPTDKLRNAFRRHRQTIESK
jgi:uncharacterized protein (DUF1778 family)